MNKFVQVCIIKYELHDSIIPYYMVFSFINNLILYMTRNWMSSFWIYLFWYFHIPTTLFVIHFFNVCTLFGYYIAPCPFNWNRWGFTNYAVWCIKFYNHCTN